jgi:hypothetical protein
MAIPESQLDTWSKIGPKQQFIDTYNAIGSVLKSTAAPYHNRSHDVFLQGSYGNDTNVYGDSDVDIVICSDASFQYDLDKLSQAEKDAFQRAYPSAGAGMASFRDQVYPWLKQNYGSDVEPPDKAIHIKPTSYRRAADVLVCIEHRQYFRFNSPYDEFHYKGVQFFAADGTSIVNFPKQHAANCTAKHQATSHLFKPTIRVFKNMRNRMINKGLIQKGIAPSYYIEGALWNVPSDKYGASYQNTVAGCLEWLHSCNRNDLVTANERRWLLRDGKPDSWAPWKFDTWLSATIQFWNAGG